MKKAFILILLLSVVFVVAVDRVTLTIFDSYQVDDRNITLARISKDRGVDSVIVCVNGVKGIVSEDRDRIVNKVRVDLVKAKLDAAELRLDYRCRNGCECDEKCDNTACVQDFIYSEEQNIESEETNGEEPEIIIIPPEEQEDEEISDETIIKPPEISVEGISVAILILIVLILGVIVLWKRS